MKKEQKGQVTVALVTVIDEEFEAVCRIFKLKKLHPGGLFRVRKLSPTGVYDIMATRSDGWGNTAAGETVTDIIEDFSPRYIVLIGIAGGVRRIDKPDGVKLGDVVIPNYIEYSELKKLHKGKTFRRSFPIDHPSYYIRRSLAEPLVDPPGKWQKRIVKKRPGSGSPKAHIGSLVAGETLLGDPKADYQKQVLTDYYRAIAVDMESMGVGREVYHQRRSPYYNPQYIVVRGISDYVYVDESGIFSTKKKKKKKKAPADNQSTRDKWRVYAAESAAAFALEMVDSLLREFGKQYPVP